MVANNVLTIWDRLLNLGEHPRSREAAEYFVSLHFPETDLRRVDELAERCQLGSLTPEERKEYEAYVLAGSILTVLQSRARVFLHGANGSAQ